MKLFVAEPDDPLVRALHRAEGRDRDDVVWLPEHLLLSATSLAYERRGTELRGTIGSNGDTLELAELDGVLLRLSRRWWPDAAFGSVQDQVFVYHETTAAWFALLADLPCPVVNRFPLGWWLHDADLPEALRDELAATLALDAAHCDPTGEAAQTTSVYLAGRHLVPRNAGGEDAAAGIGARLEQLVRWQRDSGILLARLDLDAAEPHRLRAVEASPDFAGDSPETLARVAAGLAEVWS